MVMYWVYLKNGKELAATNVRIKDNEIIQFDYMRKGTRYDKDEVAKIVKSKMIRGNKQEEVAFQNEN